MTNPRWSRLAGDPSLLLADEPTSALDPIAAARVLEVLASCCEARSMTLLAFLNNTDVQKVARSKNIPSALATAAKRKLQTRS